MARDYALHGVTSVMPTIASAPFEDMLIAAKNINEFSSASGEAYFAEFTLKEDIFAVSTREHIMSNT